MRRLGPTSLPLFPPAAAAASAGVALARVVPSPAVAAAAVVLAAVPFAAGEPEVRAELAELEALVACANDYGADERARATRRAYEADVRGFEAWCGARGLAALPATAGTVAVYLAALARDGKRPSTIRRALAGIQSAHRQRGCLWPRGEPTIARVLRGIRRRHGAPPAQKAALDDRDLAAMVGVLGGELEGLRDRALLTLGWLGAFRRSELAALVLEDVTRTREGLVVRVVRSKADQEGRGGEKAIPYASQASLCPVRALEAWLEASGITGGAIFRAVDRCGRLHRGALSDRTVARIVQRVAARAGLDPARLGGHSLRAGFCTTAARQGKSLDAIMRQTLHKTERQVRTYIRSATVWENNAAVGLV
jgi:site-specific recombinase XerD